MRLALHIESLRLEGLEGDRALTEGELAAQIESELQRLIDVWGVPPDLAQGGAVELAGQTVRLPTGVAREAVGAEVARQLMGGWFGSIR